MKGHFGHGEHLPAVDRVGTDTVHVISYWKGGESLREGVHLAAEED